MSDSVRPHRWQPTRLPRPWDSPGKNSGVGCHFLLQCMKVKSESEVAQSCLTLSDPMDCSLPGSSIHGIFHSRVLEWGAIAFSACYHKCQDCFLFYGRVIFQSYTYTHTHTHTHSTHYFLYLVTHWRACRLLPDLGYCERCCNEHGIANDSLRYWFHFLWICVQGWDYWIVGVYRLYLIEKLEAAYKDIFALVPNMFWTRRKPRNWIYIYSLDDAETLPTGVVEAK